MTTRLGGSTLPWGEGRFSELASHGISELHGGHPLPCQPPSVLALRGIDVVESTL